MQVKDKKKKFKHLYVIPTNRKMSDNLGRLYREAEYIGESIKNFDDVLFCIFEDGDNDVFRHNQKLLEAVRSSGRVDTLHLRKKEIKTFLQGLIVEDGAQIDHLFLERSYGKLINIIALVATCFDAEYVHRRDSDVDIPVDKDGLIFPAEAECGWIQKDECNVVMGGNYLGRSSIDYRMFNDDEQIVDQYLDLIEIPEDKRAMWHNRPIKVQSDACDRRVDIAEIKVGESPQLGNICYSVEILQLAPAPPHPETLGTDTFTIYLAHSLGQKVLLHSRDVLHEYTDERHSEEYFFKYYLSEVKFFDYYFLYFLIFGKVASSIANCGPAGWSRTTILQKMHDAMNEILQEAEDLIPVRQQKISGFLEVISLVPNDIIEEVSNSISERLPDFFRNTLKYVAVHQELLLIWDRLLQNSESSTCLDALVATGGNHSQTLAMRI